jgi:hypothetical protein
MGSLQREPPSPGTRTRHLLGAQRGKQLGPYARDLVGDRVRGKKIKKKEKKKIKKILKKNTEKIK